MQTSMACKPWRFLVQLPSDSRRFPPASLRETRETPVHFHAKPRHFPRKPPQFPLRAHAVPPLPSVDSHRNAPRTRACASSNSATEPTFSAHQRNARDNKPMQLSTTAIPAHEKGAREPLTLYYLVFVFTVCSILGLILETVVSYFVDGRWESRVGFIWGPFSPIYGVGGVLITLRERLAACHLCGVGRIRRGVRIFRRVVLGKRFRHCGLELYRPTLQYRRKNMPGNRARMGTCGPCVGKARRPRAERSLESGTARLARTPCLGAAHFLSRRRCHDYARPRLLDVSPERP